MEIKELYLKNFRGFEDLKITFPDSKLAVFIGVNGAGKTSVLDAIAILLSEYVFSFNEKRSNENLLSDNDVNINFHTLNIQITIRTEDKKKDYTWSQEKQKYGAWLKKNNQLKEYKETLSLESVTKKVPISESVFSGLNIKIFGSNMLPVLNYYKSSRALNINKRKDTKRDKIRSIYGYSDFFKRGLDNFDDFFEWFEKQENIENEIRLRQDINKKIPELENIRESIQTFFGHLSNACFSNLRIVRVQDDNKQIFDPTFMITKNKVDLPLEQLSDGEKMVLMVVVDIARRLVIANSQNNKPLEGKGIVLIDEIELHLHPSWQREIIPALTKTFPNIQFIISTHSPQVLSNVDGKDIFIIEDFKLVKENIYTEGRDSNSILFDVFGEEKRPKHYKEELSKLYKCIDNGEKEQATKLLNQLREKLGENDVEIQRALMYLEDLD